MMSNDELWRQLSPILDVVLDLPQDERVARAHELCGDDQNLLQEVLKFLTDADASASYLATPAGESASALVAASAHDSDPAVRIGQSLGPWELTEILGSGGMGVVYGAKRSDGQYEAEAAVKLMLGVNPNSPLRGRLLAERQTLARLDDPRIARLFDGGVSADGHPYLVMEKVVGQDLMAYCEAEQLGLQARLDVLVDVCAAVQAAHRQMVLHCDLKPSNILVTQDGALKLLDFGIAQSLVSSEASAGEKSSAGEVRLHTPGYASPEQQLKNAKLSAASDVYSLGVLLYELLVGERPPIAENGAVSPQSLAIARPQNTPRSQDLDSIIAKAMATDPNDRYDSAADLAADLARWRRREPVLAITATTGYVLRRWADRNRVITMAGVLLMFVLAGGVGATWRQARIASYERDQAQREAARATTVNRFLTGLFAFADPDENIGSDPTVMDILERGRQDIAELDAELEMQAALLSVLAGVYYQLGNYEQSEALYERELAAEIRFYGQDSEPVSETRINLAATWLELGNPDAAEVQVNLCLDYRNQHLRADPRWLWIPRSLQARIAIDRNDRAAAAAIYAQIFSSVEPDDPDLQNDMGRAWVNYGSALNGLDRLAAADSAYARARYYFERTLSEYDTHFGVLYSNWAIVVQKRGDLAQAEKYQRKALAVRRKLKHNRVAIGISLINLGNILVEAGRVEQAIPYLEEALAIQTEAFGEAHLYVGAAQINLGTAHLALADPQTADEYFRAGEKVMRAVQGDDSPVVAIAITRRGQAARAAEEWDRAALLFQEAIALHRRHLPDYRSAFGLALLELAEVELSRGRGEASRELAAEAATVLAETLGEENSDAVRARELQVVGPQR